MQVSSNVTAARPPLSQGSSVAVRPPTSAPAASTPAGPVDDATQAVVLAMATAQAMPDASSVAAMQALAGLPAAV